MWLFGGSDCSRVVDVLAPTVIDFYFFRLGLFSNSCNGAHWIFVSFKELVVVGIWSFFQR